MYIGGKYFDTKHHTYVMGILNVTPDSFSDGGKYNIPDQALYHVQEMVDAGADMIDVGGESTRPGHVRISDEEEIQRILPVIRRIKQAFDIPVSLDTYKSQVALAGLEEGVDLINDIWGLQADPALGSVVANSGAAYCLMHNRPQITEAMDLSTFLEQMKADVRRARAAGIPSENILLDPGVGFAKTQEQNLMVIGNLPALSELGYPVLLGTSRKSVVDYVLHVPTEERLEGTLATTAEAVYAHCGFVRVHDVKENVRFIRMLERTREKRRG
jgi:dihydropteroate synthase